MSAYRVTPDAASYVELAERHWSYTDRVVCVRKFQGDYTTLRLVMNAAGYKGYTVTDAGELYGLVVAGSELSQSAGNRATLTVTYEGVTETPPLPQYFIDGDKIEQPLEKHPRYRALIEDPDQGEYRMSAIRAALKETDKDKLEAEPIAVDPDDDFAVYNPLDYLKDQESKVFVPEIRELYLKMKAGRTHYALYVPVVREVSFWAVQPPLSLGGYLEIPDVPIGLPLLDGAPAVFLRQGDRISRTGDGGQSGWWQLERSWIAAPDWDPDIYSGGEAPGP